MRGLYRYETGKDLWWACAQDRDGGRVHIQRRRYNEMGLKPPFEKLPIKKSDDTETKDTGLRFTSPLCQAA